MAKPHRSHTTTFPMKSDTVHVTLLQPEFVLLAALWVLPVPVVLVVLAQGRKHAINGTNGKNPQTVPFNQNGPSKNKKRLKRPRKGGRDTKSWRQKPGPPLQPRELVVRVTQLRTWSPLRPPNLRRANLSATAGAGPGRSFRRLQLSSLAQIANEEKKLSRRFIC